MEESAESDYESTAYSWIFTGRSPYPTNAGGYKILDQLSNGTTAVVYRADCLRTKTIVAIKIIDLNITEKKFNINDVLAAHRMLPTHPSILKPHCHFIDDNNKLWVVMPYISGGSLMSIITSTSTGSLSPAIVATIIPRVLDALDIMHTFRIPHMGVKPGNILVEKNGKVLLSDYAVSTWNYEKELLCDVSSTLSSSSPVIALPYWMPPEAVDASFWVGIKADIFSLGIVALELLAGRPPISVFPESKYMLQKIKKRFDFSDKWEKEREARKKKKRCPSKLKEVINLCLRRDPAKRLSFIKLLSEPCFFINTMNLEENLMAGLQDVRERFKPAAAMEIPEAENVSSASSIQRPIVGWKYNKERMEFDPIFFAENAVMADSKFSRNVSLGDVMTCHDIEKKLQTMSVVKKLLEKQIAKLTSTMDNIRIRRENEETAAAELPPAPAPEKGE
ncbi:serine/threonine-protein kinase BLUS1-like [Andrographis paniculata]|uniref:serine/threonine-protein kinase BLUS1-like n=1 Tax=Andrographis paniculata TaxID=175694 RepID=UPI0021E99173|nr:serine/threonine-protein kinase BLUS1-like [Andrographis paniculata]